MNSKYRALMQYADDKNVICIEMKADLLNNTAIKYSK